MTPVPLWRLLLRPSLCDGCDKVRRFVTSPTGRYLVCLRCRVLGAMLNGGKNP